MRIILCIYLVFPSFCDIERIRRRIQKNSSHTRILCYFFFLLHLICECVIFFILWTKYESLWRINLVYGGTIKIGICFCVSFLRFQNKVSFSGGLAVVKMLQLPLKPPWYYFKELIQLIREMVEATDIFYWLEKWRNFINKMEQRIGL